MSNNALPTISDDLFRLVIRLNSKIFKSQELFKSFPLPPSHVKVIFFLMHHGSAPISNIAEHLSISKPNMTPIIDKLIQEDLVMRCEDPNDRRVILIEKTEKAAKLFENHKQLIKQILAEKLEVLSEEEIAKLHEAILVMMPLLEKIQ